MDKETNRANRNTGDIIFLLLKSKRQALQILTFSDTTEFIQLKAGFYYNILSIRLCCLHLPPSNISCTNRLSKAVSMLNQLQITNHFSITWSYWFMFYVSVPNQYLQIFNELVADITAKYASPSMFFVIFYHQKYQHNKHFKREWHT